MLAFALSMSACCSYPIPKSIEKSFTYRYDGKNTGIDTLINIDGFYREKRGVCILQGTSIYYLDTVYSHFMFYDNGTYASGISDIYYDDHKKKWIKKDDVSMFLKDFAENSEAPGANYFYGNNWGGYIICGDTIKVQGMYKARSLNDSWYFHERWYKIIDKNTIQCINAVCFSDPAIFYPIPSKPPPDKSWILRERWFWRNEADWKAYMENLKNEKRKMK